MLLELQGGRESGASGEEDPSETTDPSEDEGNAASDSGETQEAAPEKVEADPGRPAGDEDGSKTKGDGLSEAEEKQVDKLQQRDREVRAHEQAHARVGGSYAGAPSYSYQQGPDGKRYAIGGEVSIDTSAERTPEATARKMRVVIRAATAPAEPSSQDLKVAQQARAALAEAQAQMRQEKAAELQGEDEANASGTPGAETGDLLERNAGPRQGDERDSARERQAADASAAYRSAAERAFGEAARTSQGSSGGLYA